MDQSSGMIPTAEEVLTSYHLPPTKPLWLNCNYAKHIVKGNFLTLSAKPKTVEMGEWVAHQGKLATCHGGQDRGRTLTNVHSC